MQAPVWRLGLAAWLGACARGHGCTRRRAQPAPWVQVWTRGSERTRRRVLVCGAQDPPPRARLPQTGPFAGWDPGRGSWPLVLSAPRGATGGDCRRTGYLGPAHLLLHPGRWECALARWWWEEALVSPKLLLPRSQLPRPKPAAQPRSPGPERGSRSHVDAGGQLAGHVARPTSPQAAHPLCRREAA